MTRTMRSPHLLRGESAAASAASVAPVRSISPEARRAHPGLGTPAGPGGGRPPTAAVDAAAGEPVPHRPAAADPRVAPPRQRVPGPSGGELRAVADTPAPDPRPAPNDTVEGGADGPWALVRSAQAGDMGAFSELFDRYYDVVFRYVLFRMNDRTLAEDITQETFLRALRRITSVTYQGRDIGAWFVTIARNLIFDHVKSSRYRLESTTSDIVELSPSTHGPEQQVLELATNEELLRCVRKLNADQQECISLRFLQGLSVAETAKIMDRNEGAVKALQHRAVRRLAQLLPEGLR
jgi:RNA polymerase sigma-70 factor, ECF subfamily